MTVSNLENITAVWIREAESRYWRFEAAGEELGGVDVTAGDLYWAYVGDGEAEPIASSHSLEKMKCLVEDTVRR
jgi:hypothetical protein